MLYYPISAALNALTAAGLAVFIFFVSARQQVHRAFIYFALAVASWSSAYFVWQLADTADEALFWSRVLMMGAIYAPVTYLHFTYAFLDIYKRRRIFLWLSYGLFSIFLFFNFTPLFVSHVEPYLGFPFWPMPGPAFHVFLALWFGYLLYTVALLIKHYKLAQGHLRSQLKYVFLGIFMAFVGGATNYFPWYKIPIQPYGNILVAVYLWIFAYAITVYHLMDIWIVLRLSAVFITLFTIITAFYFAITSFLSQFFGGPLTILFPAFVITITYGPLKHLIEKLTDRIFFQKEYDFSDVINSLAGTIHQIGPDIKRTLEAFDNIIVGALKVKSSAFAFLDNKTYALLQRSVKGGELKTIKISDASALARYFKTEQRAILDREELKRKIDSKMEVPAVEAESYQTLSELNYDVAVPVKFKGDAIFIYLLGPKKSQDIFYREDINLLKHAANEIAAFIDNASLYEDLKIASEAKTRFISVVSHQLRTPLSSIKWSLETLKQQKPSRQEKSDLLKRVYDNALFLGDQLDDILTALDIYDKQIFIKKTSCHLSEIFKGLREELQDLIAAKKLEVEYRFDSDADLIHCDHEKMRKVFKTLLQNSVNYSLNGGKIQVTSHLEKAADSQRAVVSISDQGIGIIEEEREHVFEEFFRSDQARLALPNGLGLGMFVAQAFVKAHGGDIWFYSAGKNKGADFHVALPVEQGIM